jgi:hypothetical protein
MGARHRIDPTAGEYERRFGSFRGYLVDHVADGPKILSPVRSSVVQGAA